MAATIPLADVLTIVVDCLQSAESSTQGTADMSSVASSVPITTVNILVPVGALGLGVEESDVFARLPDAHAIACDAGSTDSGPAYLATGVAKYSRDSIKHDLTRFFGCSVVSLDQRFELRRHSIPL